MPQTSESIAENLVSTAKASGVALSPDLKAELDTFCLSNQSLTITTDADLANAETVRGKCRDYAEKVKATFRPMKEAAHQAHKAVCRTESDMLAPVEQLQGKIDYAIIEWNTQQREKRRLELEAAEAESIKAQEEQRLAQAEQLQAAGETETAAKVLEAPIVPMVVSAPPVKKPQTLTIRQGYDFEIVDAKKLPREYLMPDEAKIRKVASSGSVPIPGVRIFPKETVAAKRR